MRKGFTLIELLAVIVILAIIALIAVPIVINIISDSKYESQKRSIDHYAEALKQSVADYQLKNNKKVEGRFNTTDGKTLTRDDITLNVDYKGNVVCNRIVVNKDGSIYLSECTVDDDTVYISKSESNKENPKYYEYGKTEYGMIMENKSHSSKFLNTGISSSRISQFEIHTDGINVPDGYESIDCSYNQDKSVMCYWRNWEHLNRANEYEMNIAADGEIYTPYDSSYLFYDLGAGYYNSLRTLNFTGLNTSKTTNMSYMLYSVGTNLTTFIFGEKFNTSNVTNMEGMFKHFGEGYSGKFILPDNFDTSKVTNMSYMFECAFYYGTGLDLGPNFDTRNVTDMSYMFKELCRRNMKTLNLGNKFDTSNVINMSHMFEQTGGNSLIDLQLGDKFDTRNVTDMSYMFSRIEKLKTLNLENKFNTSNVTDMSGMFSNMKSINNVTFLNKINTSKVTNMSDMFVYFGSDNLDILVLGDNFDTSKVTNMSNMFWGTGYNSMAKLDLGNRFDTSKVTNMDYMFRETGHENMEELNLGNNFDTSNVTNMYWMFKEVGYKKLKKLDLGSKFVKGYSTNASNMFEGAGHDSMTELNFRNFDITLGSWINKHNALKDCGSDGILTKVVVKDQQTKQRIIDGIISTSMSPNVTTPQFWQDNDIIVVQTN